MSYASEQSSSSSYRKIFGAPGSVSRGSVASSGFRSQPGSRSASSSLGYYRRSGRSRSFSPVPGDGLDLTQSAAAGTEFKIIRTNEKEQLQGLNDRFATFIEKVRHLEHQNKVLESELVALRHRQSEPSRLAELYQQELRDLRSQVDELNAERSHVLVDRDNMEDDLHKLRAKYEEEIRAREEAEQTLRSFRKDVDDATVARLDLERKVESLLDEIHFLRKVHDEEVAELTVMMHAAQVSVEMELTKPDLTSALKEIRSQYESLASRNLQSAEEWYKTKFANLNEQAARTNEAIRASREELNDYRRQLQSKTLEMETLRGTNESLERQVREMEDGHNLEIASYQETIGQLETELRGTKSEMARHLREYQDLLNVKMALDIEIAAYRKLLEGEETHFNTGVAYSNHAPSPNYGHQARAHPAPSRSSKKDKDEEAHAKSKVAAQCETFEEIIEETIVTKKKEKSDAAHVNSS
ncbi:internexin neuronal intermediate filament protein, alpha a [Denticeps clupeoides]|uniref:internexin neuronal intermediate filament protein, alpha a n=1 Tax=Denticeps clupeoides TaxID=299321 RepID=UPI0010A5658F|nr:alpha-internexin-like [Denticeps clupeoides]